MLKNPFKSLGECWTMCWKWLKLRLRFGIEIKVYHWEIEMLSWKLLKIKIDLKSKVVKCWKIIKIIENY